MTTWREKGRFFVELLGKRLLRRGLDCPNCGAQGFSVADRKYLVAELRRCDDCRLLYRAPAEKIAESEKYYQNDYLEGFTTNLPAKEQFAQLAKINFADTEKDFTERIAVLRALGVTTGHHIFDFGCSWGYGAWQLKKEGYQVTAYEISEPRSRYAAEEMNITLIPEMPSSAAEAGPLAGTVDCFFSSHVIEHLPKPGIVFDYASALLKPGGLFVAFTPNGSKEMRAVSPANWHSCWGKKHPNMIDAEFYKNALATKALLSSSPYDLRQLHAFARGEQPICDMRGGELLCVARY